MRRTIAVCRRVWRGLARPLAGHDVPEQGPLVPAVDRLLGERPENQVAPARQKIGAGVELDVKKVAGGEAVTRGQPITNNSCP